MGILTGDVAGLFAGVFGSFYEDATLQTTAFVPDGQGGGSVTTTSTAVKVQRDELREADRVAAGYSEDDVRFIILGATVNADSRLVYAGVTYDLSDPRLDPCGSHQIVRGRPRG